MDNRPIGVFDSGLGGLTTVKELKQLLPDESIVYFGDTARVPYGTRSPEAIKKYAGEDERFLLGNNVKIIIAACGTVSAVANETGVNLPVKFFEMVTPAARAAVESTKNGSIGIIGTSATINSEAHKRKIKSLIPEARVITADCPLFVPLVEAGWTEANDEVTVATACRYLQPFFDTVDTLILGCTHYPMLEEIIAEILPGVTLINPSIVLAQDVKKYLLEHDMYSDCAAVHKYYVSDKTEVFSRQASQLLGENIDNLVETVNIEEDI